MKFNYDRAVKKLNMLMNHQKLKTLFVKRPLLNADVLREWAKSQGFESALAEADMHVTIAFSKQPLDWSHLKPITRTLRTKGGERSVEQFGDAVVLCFESNLLHDRWQEIRDAGASFDFDQFRSHITLGYKELPQDVVPCKKELIFGPEVFSEINDKWSDDVVEDDL